MQTKKILIAEDHAVMRAGLRLLIETDPQMSVVGEAGTYDEVLNAVAKHPVDVVTLDLGLPGGPSGGLIHEIRQSPKPPGIVVLTMHDDPSYARRAFAAGAAGYVVKTAADSELLDAIRAVAAGRTYCTLAQVETQQHLDPPPIGAGSRLDDLSDREREVLVLLARGFTNQQAADKLYLSVKTIESYRSRLKTKLGLRGRAEITHFAIEMGLLEEPLE